MNTNVRFMHDNYAMLCQVNTAKRNMVSLMNMCPRTRRHPHPESSVASNYIFWGNLQHFVGPMTHGNVGILRCNKSAFLRGTNAKNCMCCRGMCCSINVIANQTQLIKSAYSILMLFSGITALAATPARYMHHTHILPRRRPNPPFLT